jgi:hypothetical protein
MMRRALPLPLLAAFIAIGLLGPPATQAAVRRATPATVRSAVAAARRGDTIELAAGAYRRFTGGPKAAHVTIRAALGATVTMAGARFIGTSHMTVRGVTFTAPVDIRNRAHDVVLDHDVFDNLGQATWEGRLSINEGAYDNTVRYSHFGGNAGCSDGVFVGDAPHNTIGPGNEFTGIKQGSCSAHTDSIQLYLGPRTRIVGNYFHDSDTHIMAPDGGDHAVITDNVFVGDGYVPAVQLGSHVGTVFSHNTLRNVDVHMDAKAGNTPSSGGTITNNLFVNGQPYAPSSECTGCTIDHNQFDRRREAVGTHRLIAAPVFVGGKSPTGYAGYRLSPGTRGTRTASDGRDQGVRYGTR